MNRTLVIESSDRKRQEINYAALSTKEIDRRIGVYERRYKSPFDMYNAKFSCSDASPREMTDVMDWESLVQERQTRRQNQAGKGRYTAK